jgi:hypothetical protein
MSSMLLACRTASLPVLAAVLALAAGKPVATQEAKPGPLATFEHVNVCERVPGNELAAAVSGHLLQTRPINHAGLVAARCVYTLQIGEARGVFVVWLSPAAEYAGLRRAAEPPVTAVAGVGDRAHRTTDKDTRRMTLTALKRNSVTVQVTGEREADLKAIAALALSKF